MRPQMDYRYGIDGPWPGYPRDASQPDPELEQYGRFGKLPVNATTNGEAPHPATILNQQSELSKVLDAYTKSQEAKKKATTRKAKKQSPMPRPGALGIGLGFDLLAQLFGAKPGAFLNPALQSFQVGAAYKNQQAEEDANTLAQQDLIDAETFEKQGQIYQREYELDRQFEKTKILEEGKDARAKTAQDAALNKQAALQKEIDQRNFAQQYNNNWNRIAGDNYGEIPPDLWEEMNTQREQLIAQGVPEAALRPVFKGQTKKGGTAQIQNALREARRRQVEKLTPLKVRQITSTIDDKIKRTDAWINHSKEMERQGRERNDIARGHLGVAQGNLGMRQKEFGAKSAGNPYLPSNDEKMAGRHIAGLEEAKAALQAQIDIYADAGYNKTPDMPGYDAELKADYDKAMGQMAQLNAKILKAQDRIPKVQGMTRAQWIERTDRAIRIEGRDPTICTRMLNEALRKFPK